MEEGKLDKWNQLKLWVIKRHDYFEREYQQNGLSADANELGAFRTMYNVMQDLEKKEKDERTQKVKKTRPIPSPVR